MIKTQFKVRRKNEINYNKVYSMYPNTYIPKY